MSDEKFKYLAKNAKYLFRINQKRDGMCYTKKSLKKEKIDKYKKYRFVQAKEREPPLGCGNARTRADTGMYQCTRTKHPTFGVFNAGDCFIPAIENQCRFSRGSRDVFFISIVKNAFNG